MTTPDMPPQLPTPASISLPEFYGLPNEPKKPNPDVEADIDTRAVDPSIVASVRTAFKAGSFAVNETYTPADNTPVSAVFGWRPELPDTSQSQ